VRGGDGAGAPDPTNHTEEVTTVYPVVRREATRPDRSLAATLHRE
jgi:hypothetical protein